MNPNHKVFREIYGWLRRAVEMPNAAALDVFLASLKEERRSLVSCLRHRQLRGSLSRQDRLVHKSEHHRLAVIVPAYRIARILRNHLGTRYGPFSAEALARFLLTRVIRMPAEPLFRKRELWSRRPLPLAQAEVAQELIERHPALFPALPDALRVGSPMPSEQVAQAERRALNEAKAALLQKIQMQVHLSNDESALLRRFLG